MKTKLLLLVFSIHLLSTRLYCQDASTNTTSMPFLLINNDAKSGGMGDIGVATSSDAFSIFHNPAKIAFNKYKTTASVSYTPWMRNLTNDIFLGGGTFINRLDEKSAWGIDIKYFSLGKIKLSTDTGASNGSENLNNFSATGVYSLKLNEKFSMGIGLKYINSNYKIKSVNTNINVVNTFAVDISGYYQSDEENFGNFNGRYRLGFNIANIGPKVEYTHGFENFIPTNFKFGGGFDFIFDNSNILGINTEFTKLLVPSDPSSKQNWIEGMFSSFSDRSFSEELQETTWALSAEYSYNNKISLRIGYFHESITKGNRQFFTTGAGFRTNNFNIDLSYLINSSQINNPLENTLRFSLSFDLGEIFEDY